MTTYRLQSTGLIHTPGILRWAINGYHFKKDRAAIRRIFTEGYNLPAAATNALLAGEVTYTVDDEDAVVFTYGNGRK